MGLLVDVLVQFIGYGTGQVLLYVFTLGRRKPQWPDDQTDSVIVGEIIFRGSTWLGYLFWAVVITAIIFITRD